MDLVAINTSLEEQGWYFQKNFINDEVCSDLYGAYSKIEDLKRFSVAEIGNSASGSENLTIRKSSICWIEKSDKIKGLNELNIIFEKIMLSINRNFFLSLKSFESQIAYYNRGDFFKMHLDQFKKNNNRQVSCCLYLNDCDSGGEMIIYNKGSKVIVDKVISPKRGSLVIFFSKEIFHEVKPVIYPRFSISTWFRDDEKDIYFLK